MSSKTLALTAHAGRICGAVIESSIGSLRVTEVFDQAAPAAAAARLPVSGPFDRVIASLESEGAVFRLLTLPFRDRRRIDQAVGPALEEHVPWSLDDGNLSWDYAGATAPAAGACAVVAALAMTSKLAALRERIAALGVETEPQRLLWTPSLILGAYRRAVGESASFVAVDLSEGGGVVARLEEGRLTALRILAPCDDELLLRNTAWSVSALSGDETRVVAGGRHAARLASLLAARLAGKRIEALPVPSPVDGFAGKDWRELTALVGLVLAASGDSPSPLLDFESSGASMFSTGAWRELQGEATPLLRWAAAALVLAALAVGVDYVQLFAERNALADHAEQIYTSTMPAGSGGAGRKIKMEMRLRELTGRAESASGSGAASPLAMLAALSRDVPKDLDVTIDQVDHSPTASKVLGHAGSFETVTKMQAALQKGSSFARVEVKDVHAAVSGGVEFLLELAGSPAEGGA